ncbi:MAG: insulinase family protein [Solibacteraceae bacterium]|nr:insulinase family protein [Solibacteraceae bacterium]
MKVTTHTLENGMRILVHEDHDVPNAAMYLFYTVGSRNERPGITGISHYFEHMMFNGAKKYGPKQFDVVMEKAGGRNNAYTSRDITAYTNWFPNTAIEQMFDLEADRIRDLAFDPKIIESERGVVSSERRMAVDNSPFGTLYEQVNATAYTAHPYSWPVIGWASDIAAYSMEDLKAHFKMGYAPNNCILVMTGAVTHDQVVALAKKYLEPIPRQAPPPPVRTVEPPQLGERRIVIKRPAQLPLLLVSYHVPATKHADNAALDMLETVLSSGRSSRLHRRLVEQDQLVLSINAGQQLALDPTQFIFSMQVRSGVEPAKAEAALYEELAKIAKDGITDTELAKAKNQQIAGFYRSLKTIAGKANLLGQYEIYHGDHRKLFTAVEELEKVTAADIQRVAAQYFGENNRTVGTLIPESRRPEAAR